MTIDDASELAKLLNHMQDDIAGLYSVFHSLSEVATEHLGAARPSVRPGEDTIWY